MIGDVKARAILEGDILFKSTLGDIEIGRIVIKREEDAANIQTKVVTPTPYAQIVTPDASYKYLREVTVNAIPYVEAYNTAGGTTVTIAGNGS